MQFKYLLISVTIILSLNFGRAEEFNPPAYYYILTQPIPVDYNKVNPLGQTGEICYLDPNQQQQQQLYQQAISNTQPKKAVNTELFLTENGNNIQENQIPNQTTEIENPSPQIYSQSSEKIITESTDSNQTESSTDSGRISISTNAPVKNNSKVVDLHKVITRNTNDNQGSPKSKKSFDIVFSQEVIQQMARDLVNTFLNKIPGGVKNINFTQIVEDVEKVIKTHLPYGILSVANGEVSNLVQNVLPQLNGQPLQNLINNQNLANNYPNARNGFDSWGSFFNYVLKNGGPGLTQSENGMNYNSLFMNNNGQPDNRNFQNPYTNNYRQLSENLNYNSQFANNPNGLPDISRNFHIPSNKNFNSPPNVNNGQINDRNFNFPPGQNFNSPPNVNNGQVNDRNFNFPPGQNFITPNMNNGQIDSRNFNLPSGQNFNSPPLDNGRNFNFPLLNNNNRQSENRNFNPQLTNSGQPGFRNFDSLFPSSNNNNNIQTGGQNANLPFANNNNNNVQRRMINNPNRNIFKLSDKNFKNSFT
ncbi:putative uncharacterized protein DDB_G0286901 [Leptopilina heterotoma]|uniref:putative uncharacterized protein DDB_G0286901 n=1 Tax=Leptopilina heterotoma TaxID=63436 RepID=UPI001CA831C1|nr:putative uncharacterized protein DDB_G0286901 [Leptopilina heterotoma]